MRVGISKAGGFVAIGARPGLAKEALWRVHSQGSAHFMSTTREALAVLVQDVLDLAAADTDCGPVYAILQLHEVPAGPEFDRWYASVFPGEDP